MPIHRKGADCCGCTACAAVCSVGAVTMQPDALGFLYPNVDLSKCVGCGACERVCSFNEDYDRSLNLQRPEVYGARHKSMDEVMQSRSGAAFVALSDYVLNRGGVVYGAGYADHFRVVHKRATTKGERDEFRGSKYVQSDLTGVFVRVKRDLQDGLAVLFSGTPCQTAGLNSFVGKKLRENLLLVDIVCHGAPAPYIWRDFLAYTEKKYRDSAVVVNFRDKVRFGWMAHHETFEFSRGGVMAKEIWFTNAFYMHIMFRHSCGKCSYANTARPSDITLADFWGWQKTNPDANKDDKGISLILVNTKGGQQVFNAAKEALNVFPARLENVLQGNLRTPSVIHPKRMAFEREYAEKGFLYVYKKYAVRRPRLFVRVWRKAFRILKGCLG